MSILAFIRASRVAQIGIGVVALLIAAALWLHFHDRAVVKNHESDIAQQVTTATQAANDTANANDAARQAENARADEQLRGDISHAEAEHPEEVRRDAGPATSAALRRLRERHAAPRPTTR